VEGATLIFGKVLPRANRRLSILRSRSWYDSEGYLNYQKIGVKTVEYPSVWEEAKGCASAH
jgi:hypothetical protein